MATDDYTPKSDLQDLNVAQLTTSAVVKEDGSIVVVYSALCHDKTIWTRIDDESSRNVDEWKRADFQKRHTRESTERLQDQLRAKGKL